MNFATKLLLGSISVLLATSTIGVLHSYRVSKETLREQFAADSEEVAASIAEVLKSTAASPRETCRVAAEASHINSLAFLTVTQGGKVLCGFGQRPAVNLDLSVPEVGQQAVEQTRVYTTYASVPCEKKDCQPLELEIGISFAHLETSLALFRKHQIQNTVVLILSAAIFLFLFSMVVRRRLEKLTQACAKVQRGDLDLQLAIGGKDEISRVAEAMNRMARDLRSAAEEKDRQRQTLLQTSKMSALGEMAGGMAHEINNPLAIIKMLSAQMGECLAEEPLNKPLLAEMLSKIEKTSERIAKIVTGLRTFSREGSNDPFVPVKVAELVDDTIVLCRDRFAHHTINLQVESIDPALAFKGRSTQISQVLLNLLNNAHDAVAGNQEKKWVKISAQSTGDFVEIRVTDSNHGIPPEIQKKIFQPFFTTKEVGKGTGMGLSISMGIVKIHGGELKLDETNPNTSFVIKLPKA